MMVSVKKTTLELTMSTQAMEVTNQAAIDLGISSRLTFVGQTANFDYQSERIVKQ